MGSIDFQIAALHDGPAANGAENVHVPQSQVVSPVLPARGVTAAPPPKAVQDTVSLSGSLLPQQRQQTASSAGNAQPATFTLLPQTTAFPPTQDTATAATSPTIQNNAPAVAAAPAAQTPGGGHSVSRRDGHHERGRDCYGGKRFEHGASALDSAAA